jgi:hypothetical protein
VRRMGAAMSEHLPLTPVHLPSPAAVAPAAPVAHRGGRVYAAWAVVSLLMLLATALVGWLAWDDARAHQDAAQRAQRASDLARELGLVQDQARGLSSQVASLTAENARLQAEARSPTLTMWNSCAGPCTIGPGTVRVGSAPDTFELLIAFTADVPVRTYVFTFQQWSEFDGCGFSVRCVSGTYKAFDAATSVNTTFSDAEGCSGYVWVLQSDSAGTVRPNVRVRYQPAGQPTGVCAGSP